jgi:hypothetical protein
VEPIEQISLDRVAERMGSLFGEGWEESYGGGGTGGKYMFASIDELNAVITQWEGVQQALAKDADTIEAAARFVEEPAGDEMSVGQANATRDSLVELKKHNEDMKKYAEEYIQKLKDSRDSMANTDQAKASQLGNIDRS